MGLFLRKFIRPAFAATAPTQKSSHSTTKYIATANSCAPSAFGKMCASESHSGVSRCLPRPRHVRGVSGSGMLLQWIGLKLVPVSNLGLRTLYSKAY
jgi:hypothetical protein